MSGLSGCCSNISGYYYGARFRLLRFFCPDDSMIYALNVYRLLYINDDASVAFYPRCSDSELS